MPRNFTRSNPKIRQRLSNEEWRVYQQGLKSLAVDANHLLFQARNALDALHEGLKSFSDLCSEEVSVSEKQLLAAYKSIKKALGEVERCKDFSALVEIFRFEQDDYAALTPLGKFAVELERASSVSNDLKRRCNYLMDGYIPALS